MQVMIRYKLKPGEVGRNLELLDEFYAELDSVQPDGLREATFQLDDKVTFLTFVDVENGPEVLKRLDAFQRYRTTLDARCEEPPVMTVLNEVGAFRFR
jgi:hypothetical protein